MLPALYLCPRFKFGLARSLKFTLTPFQVYSSIRNSMEDDTFEVGDVVTGRYFDAHDGDNKGVIIAIWRGDGVELEVGSWQYKVMWLDGTTCWRWSTEFTVIT